jgi:hypothetical protein
MAKPDPPTLESRITALEQSAFRFKVIASAVLGLAAFLGWRSWAGVNDEITKGIEAAFPRGLTDSLRSAKDSAVTRLKQVDSIARNAAGFATAIERMHDTTRAMSDASLGRVRTFMQVDSLFVSSSFAPEWADTLQFRVRIRSAWIDLGHAASLLEYSPVFREGESRLILRFKARNSPLPGGKARYTAWVMGW